MSAETSPPSHWQSALPFSQEIIDNIIDELSSDKDTLKQCSTVSQSFYVPSRRHLFSSINLYEVETAVLFHCLLIQTPDIARHVRMIEVGFPRSSTYVDAEGEEVDVTEWLGTSTVLAEVLASLPRVETLVWDAYAEWHELSCGLQSALVKLFQCNLTTIDISYLSFPLSALHIVSPVKKLELTFLTWLDVRNKGHVILPHLEVLKLNGCDPELGEGNGLVVPNLRYISFAEDSHDSLPGFLAEEAINSSGTSLQRLWWDYPLSQEAHISLNGMRCLQFLTVTIHTGSTGFANWGRNFHIASILSDTSVTQTLKDLTIGIESSHENFIDTDWRDLYDSKIWKDLDIVLSPVSTLQRLLIHADFLYFNSIPAELWAGMRESMPLLEERGILTFKYGRDAYPERDMWTDS